MSNESGVPTLPDIWDFLVGLKETTQAGFERMTADLTDLKAGLRRVEDRLVHIEAMNIDRQLLDHERRITLLEKGQI